MLLTQFWDDPSVPEEIQNVLATFQMHNPTWSVSVYDAGSARRLIEQHFTAREVAAFDKCAVPAMQADYFRLCALLSHAGWYADADSPCVGSLDALIPASSEALFFKRESWGPVMNSLMWVRAPGHPFLAAWLELVTQNIEEEISNDVWAATGPANSTFLYFSAADDIGMLDGWAAHCTPDWLAVMEKCRLLVKSGKYADLLRGVRVRPLADTTGYWQESTPLQYKGTKRDWRRWPRSIYVK